MSKDTIDLYLNMFIYTFPVIHHYTDVSDQPSSVLGLFSSIVTIFFYYQSVIRYSLGIVIQFKLPKLEHLQWMHVH